MAGTMTATVSRRISLGGTEYIYFGTLKPDASYVTGGDTILGDGGQVNLPSTIHHMTVTGAGGLSAEFVAGATPKVKLMLGAESGAGLKGAKEMAEAVDASAVSLPFVAYGN